MVREQNVLGGGRGVHKLLITDSPSEKQNPRQPGPSSAPLILHNFLQGQDRKCRLSHSGEGKQDEGGSGT